MHCEDTPTALIRTPDVSELHRTCDFLKAASIAARYTVQSRTRQVVLTHKVSGDMVDMLVQWLTNVTTLIVPSDVDRTVLATLPSDFRTRITRIEVWPSDTGANVECCNLDLAVMFPFMSELALPYTPALNNVIGESEHATPLDVTLWLSPDTECVYALAGLPHVRALALECMGTAQIAPGMAELHICDMPSLETFSDEGTCAVYRKVVLENLPALNRCSDIAAESIAVRSLGTKSLILDADTYVTVQDCMHLTNLTVNVSLADATLVVNGVPTLTDLEISGMNNATFFEFDVRPSLERVYFNPRVACGNMLQVLFAHNPNLMSIVNDTETLVRDSQ